MGSFYRGPQNQRFLRVHAWHFFSTIHLIRSMIMSQISISARKTALKLACQELLRLINSELNVGRNCCRAPTILPPWTLQGQWLPPLSLLAAVQKTFLFVIAKSRPWTKVWTTPPTPPWTVMTVVDSQSHSVTLIETDLSSLLPSAVQSLVPISSSDKWWLPSHSLPVIPAMFYPKRSLTVNASFWDSCIRKASLPTRVSIRKWTSAFLFRLCFRLMMVCRPNVSVWWRGAVNKTHHRDKTLVPISEGPLIIRLSSCIHLLLLQENHSLYFPLSFPNFLSFQRCRRKNQGLSDSCLNLHSSHPARRTSLGGCQH